MSHELPIGVVLGFRQHDADAASLLKQAYDEVEDEEDEQSLSHQGMVPGALAKSLGLKAVLPPPEEKQDVKTAIDAAKVGNARKDESRKSRR